MRSAQNTRRLPRPVVAHGGALRFCHNTIDRDTVVTFGIPIVTAAGTTNASGPNSARSYIAADVQMTAVCQVPTAHTDASSTSPGSSHSRYCGLDSGLANTTHTRTRVVDGHEAKGRVDPSTPHDPHRGRARGDELERARAQADQGSMIVDRVGDPREEPQVLEAENRHAPDDRTRSHPAQ